MPLAKEKKKREREIAEWNGEMKMIAKIRKKEI